MLNGKRVLVVEDAMMLAIQVEAILEDLGCEVRGPVPSVRRALREIADEPVDAAVLDINLGDEDIVPVADELARRGVPIIFASAYDRDHLPERHRNWPLVSKPFTARELAKVLRELVGNGECQRKREGVMDGLDG